jgi:hypothetical protein
MNALIVAAALAAAPAEPAEPKPDLNRLRDEVERVVHKHYPKATVTLKGTTVSVDYEFPEALLACSYMPGVHATLELRTGPNTDPKVVAQTNDNGVLREQVLTRDAALLDYHLMARLTTPSNAPEAFRVEFEQVVRRFDRIVFRGLRVGC